MNLEDIGKKLLDLTNQQRKANGLADLVWSPELSKLAEQHSLQMASGAVPFGHQGAEERHKKIPFPTTGNTENVAFHNDRRQPAESAMRVWLGIEGNVRNINGNYTHCGVGVAKKANGEYYFTQILSKRT
ncbi:hypothetical protein SAMD00019534_029060, partial [Acytostelium subglobosum LB1]|uniref:hypothetical protein n=1 Tax=Acytostelium subglobosum LB1 TaxID=1410327 RepID=UPI000644AA28